MGNGICCILLYIQLFGHNELSKMKQVFSPSLTSRPQFYNPSVRQKHSTF